MQESHKGLTSYEARRRLEEYGPNILPEKKPVSSLVIFISQLKSPLVYVLIFAGVVTLFLRHFTDSFVILIAVVINTLLGFVQEKKASSALIALKKLIELRAIVVRDGHEKVVSADEVVPGDVCVLNSGDKIPADGKIVFANRLFVSEAVLTGESMPVSKETGDEVFMGTVITSGRGKFLVSLTGSSTQIGKIAKDIQAPSEDTPIKKQLKKFSSQLTFIISLLTLTVFIVGLVLGKDPFEIFTTSVALAVSAIPEGLLVGLTAVLAIGMQRILKRQGLVRNLVSAETLGGVTTICVDKTGTLTEGKMEVSFVLGNKKEVARQALLANDQDDPLVVALWDWGSKNINWEEVGHENVDDFLKHRSRIDSIPFSAKERYFASLNKYDSKTNYLYVNGAPEFVLDWSDLSKKEKVAVQKRIEKYASEGLRLIALANKVVSSKHTKIKENDAKHGLSWVGLVAFSDPVRKGVKEVLKETARAGIRTVVITGDYWQTASSVLNQLGLSTSSENIVLGKEINSLTENEIAKKVLNVKHQTMLFARTTPEQKLKIVNSLKAVGEVVAMTGDGVNDALALKKADIGIVVGNASDVAKESADLVLLDSSFATIVASVEEGRLIFANIRKVILYLLTGSFSEIVVVLGAMVLGYPLPLVATQILWINLVSDSFPHLALTVDPKSTDIMKLPPRDSTEPLVARWMGKIILTTSIAVGLVSLAIFIWLLDSTKNVKLAQSVAFAILGVTSLVYVFSLRTLEKSFLSQNPFGNKWLNIAFLLGMFLQVFPFLFSTTRSFLSLESLGTNEWLLVFQTAGILFVMIEILKRIVFKNSKK